jgi:hypothetical protein
MRISRLRRSCVSIVRRNLRAYSAHRHPLGRFECGPYAQIRGGTGRARAGRCHPVSVYPTVNIDPKRVLLLMPKWAGPFLLLEV